MDIVINIVDYYYESAGYYNVLPTYKNRSISVVKNLIDNGYTDKDVIAIIDFYIEYMDSIKEKPSIDMNDIFKDEIMKKALYKNNPLNEYEYNLIEKNKKYYHRLLRNTSSAPKIIIKDDGTIEKVVDEYKLQIVKSFTMRQLLEYFYTEHCVEDIYKNYKRDAAAFKYLFKIFSNNRYNIEPLDLVLYSIDVSRAILINENRKLLINILDLQDYIQQALEIVLEKIDYEKINNVEFK